MRPTKFRSFVAFAVRHLTEVWRLSISKWDARFRRMERALQASGYVLLVFTLLYAVFQNLEREPVLYVFVSYAALAFGHVASYMAALAEVSLTTAVQLLAAIIRLISRNI